MPVVIGEIVSEVVLSGPDAAPGSAAPTATSDEDVVEEIVRRATARVLEHLRREWDR